VLLGRIAFKAWSAESKRDINCKRLQWRPYNGTMNSSPGHIGVDIITIRAALGQ